MYKHILKEASDEQLREFVDGALGMLKETNTETYKTLDSYLYKIMYGSHFNSEVLKEAVSKMINEDGTTGGHWTLEQTNNVARQNGITFDTFNEYDWNYVMNMMYSDYYGVVPNDVLVKLAIRFLMDKDAKEGKAYCYYMAIKK